MDDLLELCLDQVARKDTVPLVAEAKELSRYRLLLLCRLLAGPPTEDVWAFFDRL